MKSSTIGPRVARQSPGWTLGLFGVVLPTITLLVELLSGMCAEAFADPLPTPIHVALVAAVPACIGWMIYQLHSRQLTSWSVAGLGGAVGVASYYALLFLPIAPVALLMVVFLGLGLLALAPLLSLIAGLSLLRRLGMMGVPRRAALVGGGAAWLLLVGCEVPSTANRIWISWAISEDPVQRARGLERLRSWGDPELLLSACHSTRPLVPGILHYVVRPWIRTPSLDEARTLYFRVTGQRFQSSEEWPADAARGAFDENLGDDIVGGHVEGLRLSASRLDGSVAEDAALGYLEWTLTFENTSKSEHEARALIALPSSGVVSRASLWVHGEPREATFAAKGKARAAYASVVRRRQDPLLITQFGPERVLVQCFPVPPASTMKIRIGITFPLVPEDDTHAAFTLPYFVERNFRLPDELRHAIWLESQGTLGQSGSDLKVLPAGHGLHGTVPTGALRDAVLNGRFSPARHYSEPPALSSNAQDGGAEEAVVDLGALAPHVIQEFEQEAVPDEPGLVIALDTSKALAAEQAKIVEELVALAKRAPLTIVLAHDDAPRELRSLPQEGTNRLRSALLEVEFVGGRDSVAALSKALDVAAESDVAQVLWLTSSQDAELNAAEGLAQRLERPARPQKLVPFTFGEGEPAVLRDLPPSAVERPVRRGTALQDLAGFVRSSGGTRWRVRRSLSGEPVEGMQPTGRHLTRLWAAQHIEQGCPSRAADDCLRLAVQQQLVTSITGAVVLETAQQYEEAGLKVAPGTDVPSVPEPASWLLAALMLALFAVAHRRHPRT